MSASDWHRETLSNRACVYTSSSHAFGTDAFLLAHFAAPHKRERVCDLGTGCGIIPLIFARDDAASEVLGVELQEQGAAQFKRAIEETQTKTLLRACCADLRALPAAENGRYDLVTCNPPYKAAGRGILSGTDAQQLARQETMCTLNDVCAAAKRLLRFGGRLCICQRPERLADAMITMRQNGLEPKRLQLVCRDKDSAPWLFLLMGQKGAKMHLNVLPNFILYESGQYTAQTRAMYGESFLHDMK